MDRPDFCLSIRPPFEFIILDNFSSTRIAPLVRCYARLYPLLRDSIVRVRDASLAFLPCSLFYFCVYVYTLLFYVQCRRFTPSNLPSGNLYPLFFFMFKDEWKDSSAILLIFYRTFDDNTLDDYDQMKTLRTNNFGTFWCVDDTLLFHRSIARDLWHVVIFYCHCSFATASLGIGDLWLCFYSPVFF